MPTMESIPTSLSTVSSLNLQQYIPYVIKTDPASVSSNTTSITINETDRIALYCFITGLPQPNISWYHRNEKLHSNSYLTIAHVSTSQTALIIQHSSQMRDDGIYTCQAVNNVTNLINARQSQNITVNIQGNNHIDLTMIC